MAKLGYIQSRVFRANMVQDICLDLLSMYSVQNQAARTQDLYTSQAATLAPVEGQGVLCSRDG